MSRTLKTVLSIVGIIVGAMLLSVLAYYIGSALSKSFLGVSGIKHSTWQNHYFSLVMYMGIISGLISLGWYLLARFVLKVEFAFNIGKRTLWCLIGAAELILCVAVPYIVAGMDPILKMNISIPLIFVCIAGVLGR